MRKLALAIVLLASTSVLAAEQWTEEEQTSGVKKVEYVRYAFAGQKMKLRDLLLCAKHLFLAAVATRSSRNFVHGRSAPRAVLEAEQNSITRLADAYRIGQHGLEHGLQLTGRARNRAQHLSGRGLLLQRLGEVLPSLGEFAPVVF